MNAALDFASILRNQRVSGDPPKGQHWTMVVSANDCVAEPVPTLFRHGDVAVNRTSTGARKWYAVTHTGTGLAFARMRTLRRAKALCVALGKRMPEIEASCAAGEMSLYLAMTRLCRVYRLADRA